MRYLVLRILLVLIVLTVLGLTAANTAVAERVAIKVHKANVRSGPSSDHDVIWQVEKYHPLQIVEKKGTWLRFKDFEGDTGWIHSSLVDKTQTVIVKNERCNVRTEPGTQYDVAFTVGKGIPFKVLQKKGRWIQVLHADGDQGWIFSSLVW